MAQYIVTVSYRDHGWRKYGFFPSHEEARQYGMQKVEALRQADPDRPNLGVEAGGVWRETDPNMPSGFKVPAMIDVSEVLPPD